MADAAPFICRISFHLMFLFWVDFSRLQNYSFISNLGENLNFYTLVSFFFLSPLDIFPLSRGNLFLTSLDIGPLRTM